MGRPPAYIFVVRHGKRLDAADKQWHLTSPTPYDPPLTYGGWIHSRTVGARIAAILRDEAAVDVPLESSSPSSTSSVSSPAPHKQRRRRFRIVLHSSPFLRCVQTSIAISAGLASHPIASPSSSHHMDPVSVPVPVPVPIPSSSGTPPTETPCDAPVSSTAGSRHGHDLSAASPRHVEKSVLRLDAFLGEWLSPDYFEHITPPPESALMLATAKAELLRRSSYHDYPHFHAHVHSSTSSHLWSNGSGTHQAHASQGPPTLDTLSGLADSLPGPAGGASKHLDPKRGREPTHEHQPVPGYVFPVPSYALSTSEPIPRGYVAHARDACASIDYQWDSSRDHLAWGDGGTLPEEWASMHQRFRRGLRRLVDWYSSTENAAEMVTKMANTPHPSERDVGDQADEIEDVVVLVSHGAGCNALIGALTQQPVLTDVAMSSLTMAKRRAGFDSRNISLTREKSLTSLDAALHTSRATMPEMYELKLAANTDHLSTPSSSSGLRPSASSTRPNTRSRFHIGHTSALKDIDFDSLYRGTTSMGSMTQSPTSLELRPSIYNPTTSGITVGSGISSFSVTRPDRSSSGTWGLWSPRRDDNGRDPEPEPPVFLDFSHEKVAKDKQVSNVKQEGESESSTNEPAPAATTTTPTAHDGKGTCQPKEQDNTPDHDDEDDDEFDEEIISRPRAGTGSGGLWGAPQPPGEAELLRDFSAHKRRWTVTER
ncbi:hypothetical protein F5Y14DRAFT_83279 [Nemania sp. NC0429]|nr:hypothetical protein F5Y14DRAFT_83279 [Nemania sp. NC0429]